MSDWQPASKLVADGDAAFNIMGDWAYGYFANPAPNGLALKPHTDFDWAVSPGTYGVFNFLSDSFVLPANGKNAEGTMAWLTVAASKEGQEAFNPLKGSICARTDCDQTKFSEYSQDAAKDWASNQVVGSLFHGVVAAPAWVNKISTAIGLFQASKMDPPHSLTCRRRWWLPARPTAPASKRIQDLTKEDNGRLIEPPICPDTQGYNQGT